MRYYTLRLCLKAAPLDQMTAIAMQHDCEVTATASASCLFCRWHKPTLFFTGISFICIPQSVSQILAKVTRGSG